MTELLKKDCFTWKEESTQDFNTLKQALVFASVLNLPNFSKRFIVETDASGKCIGTVLMQDHHHIAYIGKALGPKQHAMSIYERELLVIVDAVQKWSSYLAHAPFTIKTYQKSIKYTWEQKLNTPFQQVWVSELHGFDFDILYKNGSSNMVVDALSRKKGDELLALILNNASNDP